MALAADVYGADEEEEEKDSVTVPKSEGFTKYSSKINCDLLKQLIVAHLLHLFQDEPFGESSVEIGSDLPWFIDGYREASEAGPHICCRRFAARFIGSGSTDLYTIGKEIRRVVSHSKRSRIVAVPLETKLFDDSDWAIHRVSEDITSKDLCITEEVFNDIYESYIKPNIGKEIVLFNLPFKRYVWDPALSDSNLGFCIHLQKIILAINRDNEDCLKRTGMISMDKKLWVKDSERSHCSLDGCRNKFSLKKRRHHCRFCKDIFCERHCSKKSIEQMPIGIILDDIYAERETIRFSYPEKKELRICPVCDDKYHYFTEYYKYSIYADICRGDLHTTVHV